MVYALDPALISASEQEHAPGWTAQAFYGPDLKLAEVPLTKDGRLTFDADGQVRARGSVFLARDGGLSMIPRSMTDPLAPYGQELAISRTLTVGGKLAGSIPMGRFRITDVPDTREYFRKFPLRDPSNPANDPKVVVGWACELQLQDRFESIIADDFLEATGPLPDASCWSEIRRLSPYPIIVSLPDKAVPAGVVYDSRYGGIKMLINALGGEPMFTRQGALTARVKDVWMTATESVFIINGVIDMNRGMSNNLINQVIVTSTIGGNDLVAVARITDESNPLAVTRPIGGRTASERLPLETQSELDAAAETILERVSKRQARTVRITCLPRADLDIGDFGTAKDATTGEEVTGEVANMSFSLDPKAPMTLELVAAETR